MSNKKLTLVFAMSVLSVLLIGKNAKADPLCTSLGQVNLCVPLSSLDAAYGYNIAAKKGTSGNQALIETVIGSVKDLAFTFGAAKTSGDEASPFFSLTYGLRNPVTDSNNFWSNIKPGVYGGKNFDTREYIYGFKASTKVF